MSHDNAESHQALVERRLEELETRVAFQEETIHQLNDVVVQLRQQLDRLESNLTGLQEKLATSGVVDTSVGASTDERPPHY